MEIGEGFEQEEYFLSQELDVSMNSEEGDNVMYYLNFHKDNFRDPTWLKCVYMYAHVR